MVDHFSDPGLVVPLGELVLHELGREGPPDPLVDGSVPHHIPVLHVVDEIGDIFRQDLLQVRFNAELRNHGLNVGIVCQDFLDEADLSDMVVLFSF